MRPDTPPIHFIIAALVAEVKCCPAQIHTKTGLGMSSEINGQSAPPSPQRVGKSRSESLIFMPQATGIVFGRCGCTVGP